MKFKISIYIKCSLFFVNQLLFQFKQVILY